jgi:hypothetical protein
MILWNAEKKARDTAVKEEEKERKEAHRRRIQAGQKKRSREVTTEIKNAKLLPQIMHGDDPAYEDDVQCACGMWYGVCQQQKLGLSWGECDKCNKWFCEVCEPDIDAHVRECRPLKKRKSDAELEPPKRKWGVVCNTEVLWKSTVGKKRALGCVCHLDR